MIQALASAVATLEQVLWAFHRYHFFAVDGCCGEAGRQSECEETDFSLSQALPRIGQNQPL